MPMSRRGCETWKLGGLAVIPQEVVPFGTVRLKGGAYPGYHAGGRSCSSGARGELQIAFFGVGVVADISPLAESGWDEAFGLAVGAGSVRGRVARL
jgi:hypothetical protein